ncbi:MAG: TPR end-of-group domain-containing protein, partial [Gemmataceae bacterium]
AEEALILDAKAPNLYQVACIYALTSRQQSDDRLQVIRLLAPALRQGFGVDIVDSDPDLEPVRQLPEFQRIVAAAKERQRDEARAN